MAVGGQNTLWKHGTHGALSTNTDFSGKTRQLSVQFDQETVDATVFGDAYKDYEASFKNATVSVTYKYDATVFGQIADLYTNGETVTFEFAPNGNTTGYPKITGSMFIKDFKMDLQTGTLEEIPVSWQPTGAITFTTY